MISIYVEGGQPVHGHMDFQGPELEGGCFEIWKRGANCFDFYSTRSSASWYERR